MNSLPTELWLRVFDCFHHFEDRPSLALICRVCKKFNAWAQPLLFQKIKGDTLSDNTSLAKALCGKTGIALGLLVKEVDVEVTMEMLPMHPGGEWQSGELLMAKKQAELQLHKTFALLSICPNISLLQFSFELWDADESKDSVRPDEFDEVGLPVLHHADILALPCIPMLRSLRLETGWAYYFDLQALGHLLRAAEQLEELTLDLGDSWSTILSLDQLPEAVNHRLVFLEIKTHSIVHPKELSHIANAFPKLESLQLRQYYHIRTDKLSFPDQETSLRFPNLLRLHIELVLEGLQVLPQNIVNTTYSDFTKFWHLFEPAFFLP